MTAKLSDSEREKRRRARQRGDRLAARSPHHDAPPIPPRPLCSICGAPMYHATSTCHAQCAWEDAWRQWEERRPPETDRGRATTDGNPGAGT
jgi:hypothetical protein